MEEKRPARIPGRSESIMQTDASEVQAACRIPLYAYDGIFNTLPSVTVLWYTVQSTRY